MKAEVVKTLTEMKQTRYEQVLRPEACKNEQKAVKEVTMSKDEESNIKNLQQILLSRQLAEVANHENNFYQEMEVATNAAQFKVTF